jgi:hypothetical protein
MAIGCGIESLTTPLPQPLGDGAPHSVQLQLLPDGRLAVALDGRPLAVIGSTMPLDRPYRVRIGGQSHRTRLEVGSVTVWTGVREDIDWRTIPDSMD